MKRSIGVFAVLMLVVPAASAYQVTVPVLDVTDNKIVGKRTRRNGKIERDKDTKVTGPIEERLQGNGQYRMTATSIESKDTKSSTDSKAAKETKTPAAKDSKAPATKDKAMAK